MPFKIVETIENGKRLLTTVPAQWEESGTLYWPRKNESILKCSEHSVPEANWRKMPCILKRNYIPTLECSENEIKLMSDMSDTDQEVVEVSKVQETNLIDFNNLATECVSQQSETMEVVAEIVPDISDLFTEVSEETETKSKNPKFQDSITEKLDLLISLATANESNLQVLFENQQHIIQKIVSVDTKLEKFIKHSSVQPSTSQGSGSWDFKVIGTVEELKIFEEQLSNPQVAESVMKTLSVICSNGKGRGFNNAYSLVDAMFTRQLMTQCSWAGGTRGEPKICFKALTKTVSLFFSLVHQSDSSFTKPDCEAFLKNVLRHSIKRNEAKQSKKSAVKRRMNVKRTERQDDSNKNKNQADNSNNVSDVNKENEDMELIIPLDLLS